MYVEQLYTNCLAQAAYYIESETPEGKREAAIIDPIRDVEQYLEKATERGATIKYIFETHFHADFVSGHLDLARDTGATIVFGPTAAPAYSVHVARDREEFRVGSITLQLLHTPGHTPESSCLLLFDEDHAMKALFTGDTLFVGDVGRPDLLDGKMSKEELAGMMYDSLQCLRDLPDDLTVYPAHGPGSACGKNIGKETWTTLGVQKRTNYAMQQASKAEFVRVLTEGLAAPPQYYFEDARINKEGYEPIDEVLDRRLRPIGIEQFARLAADSDVVVLDTRDTAEYERAHIPNSVYVGLSGTYAWWVGTLLPISTRLAIVADPGKEEESVRRLARIGYENIAGFLAGGFESWRRAGLPTLSLESIEPEQFDSFCWNKPVIDVRNRGEFAAGHISDASNLPLAAIENEIARLDPSNEYVLHCAGGYRSVIAASFMERAGFQNLVNVHGGFGKLSKCSERAPTSMQHLA